MQFWDADVKGNKIEAISWRSSQESMGENHGGGVCAFARGWKGWGRGFQTKE